MTDLFKIRNAIALNGMMDADQLSRLLHTPLPFMEAMLSQLTIMGKIEAVEEEQTGCNSRYCKSCSHNPGCHKRYYKMSGVLK